MLHRYGTRELPKSQGNDEWLLNSKLNRNLLKKEFAMIESRDTLTMQLKFNTYSIFSGKINTPTKED